MTKQFYFYYKNSSPKGINGCIGRGEDAESALKGLFGTVTDGLLDLIERWEILIPNEFGPRPQKYQFFIPKEN